MASPYDHRRLSRDYSFTGGGALPGPAALTPSSASTATFPSPNASSSRGHRLERREYADLDADAAMNGDEPSSKRQKRNKPTLSCHECVERKTKVSAAACT